jgi:hypothetical protein
MDRSWYPVAHLENSQESGTLMEQKVLEYMCVAHVTRPMRPMYATLYSYPSRVSLINEIQQKVPQITTQRVNQYIKEGML